MNRESFTITVEITRLVDCNCFLILESDCQLNYNLLLEIDSITNIQYSEYDCIITYENITADLLILQIEQLFTHKFINKLKKYYFKWIIIKK